MLKRRIALLIIISFAAFLKTRISDGDRNSQKFTEGSQDTEVIETSSNRGDETGKIKIVK